MGYFAPLLRPLPYLLPPIFYFLFFIFTIFISRKKSPMGIFRTRHRAPMGFFAEDGQPVREQPDSCARTGNRDALALTSCRGNQREVSDRAHVEPERRGEPHRGPALFASCRSPCCTWRRAHTLADLRLESVLDPRDHRPFCVRSTYLGECAWIRK